MILKIMILFSQNNQFAGYHDRADTVAVVDIRDSSDRSRTTLLLF